MNSKMIITAYCYQYIPYSQKFLLDKNFTKPRYLCKCKFSLKVAIYCIKSAYVL